MMLKPTGPRVLVKRLDPPKPESSLIEVVSTSVDKPSAFALVLAVGKLEQGGFDVGDTVILTDYAGAPCAVEIEGERIEAAVVFEKDVLAVVEGM